MSEENYEATLDHPCAFCKRFELNDAELGGEVQVDANGESCLSFGVVHETEEEHYKFSMMSFGGLNDPSKIITSPRTQIHLGYHRRDIFPKLPGFAETANQGCEFCAMLRQDLLSVWQKHSKYDDVRARVESKDASSKGDDKSSSKCNGVQEAAPAEEEPPADGTILIDEIDCQYGLGDRARPQFDSLVIHFRIFDGGKSKKASLSYNISTYSSDKCAGWLNIWRRPVAREVLSMESLKRMNSLLEETVRRVSPPSENLYLPTRLIDVGSVSQPVLRIVVPKDNQSLLESDDPATKRYVALSYCWGSKEEADKQLKTTRDTFHDHLDHLEPEKLPQTIADAVKLCRMLNVRYLWVDALCIIQGDVDDWARESFEMSNVYANSFWTACVVRGTSCLSGFLHPRRSCPRLAVNFRSALEDSVSGKFYMSLPRPANEIVNFGNPIFPEQRPYRKYEPADEIGWSKWNSRGWTFQEGQLSKRMILFGDHMFYVSCADLHESEDGSQFLHHTLAHKVSQCTELKEDSMLDKWFNWVREYVRRDLTVTADKLPALSAMARTVSGFYPGQRYLAGLWEADLHRGLLWTASTWKPFADYTQDRQKAYIAPSWSWACHSHEPEWIWGIGKSRYSFTREFDFRNAKLDIEPGNPFGRVSGGHILLDAKLFRVPLGPNGRSNVVFGPEGEGRAWLYMIFHFTLRSQEDEYIAHFHFDWDYQGSQHVDGYPDGPTDQLWMVYISSTKMDETCMNQRRYLKDPEITLGLLLIPAENGDGFVKVGLWHSETRALGGKKFWEHIQPCKVKLV